MRDVVKEIQDQAYQHRPFSVTQKKMFLQRPCGIIGSVAEWTSILHCVRTSSSTNFDEALGRVAMVTGTLDLERSNSVIALMIGLPYESK